MVSDSKMVFQPGNKKIVGKLWEKIILACGLVKFLCCWCMYQPMSFAHSNSYARAL